jgi:hypothetical protein
MAESVTETVTLVNGVGSGTADVAGAFGSGMSRSNSQVATAAAGYQRGTYSQGGRKDDDLGDSRTIIREGAAGREEGRGKVRGRPLLKLPSLNEVCLTSMLGTLIFWR